MSDDAVDSLSVENGELKARIDKLERKNFELDKKLFELKVLYEIAKETTTIQEIDSMLKIFLSMTMGTFGITKGLIVIDQGPERGWEALTFRGVQDLQSGLQIVDFNHLKRLFKLKETWLINTEHPDVPLDFLRSELFQWLISNTLIVWVPIIIDNEVIGGILIGEKISGESFNKDNLNLLSVIASNCALNVRNAKLFQENLEKERIQRENEELKRLDKKKSEFVNMVAHELRTPLTSISGFSELMVKKAESKPRETLKKYSAIIFQESDRLRRIINDLLDLSRIRSGKVEMEMELSDFNRVMEIALTNIRITADKKNITITENIPASIDTFFFDKDKMTQVMLNLLSNAVKYTMEDGKVSVNVNLQDGNLKCVVTDTGVGIPQSDLNKVFEEFHRVNNEMSKTQRGTGLGLPITKSIIEAHEGEIWVESEEGVGSSFLFSIPMPKEKA
ncbi:sensor histidine kinase [candidate division CSSED10-310 bacterium]|uniref:histidine kinase n=1 Tax=candidate division CSSED10-310 bacterium TaxID=2855610 RepID=A0ABV6YSP6_UNCC1